MILTRSNPKVVWPTREYSRVAFFLVRNIYHLASVVVFFKARTKGMSYIKTNRKEIIRYPAFSESGLNYKDYRKVEMKKGGLILLDEFEQKGGCEDDLWV